MRPLQGLPGVCRSFSTSCVEGAVKVCVGTLDVAYGSTTATWSLSFSKSLSFLFCKLGMKLCNSQDNQDSTKRQQPTFHKDLPCAGCCTKGLTCVTSSALTDT